MKEFSTKYTTLKLSAETDMELEFPPLTPPAVELAKDSFIYCASEIFRYLRDMALNIPLSQSKPLLRPPKSVKSSSPTVAESSTPILPHIDGGPRKFFSGFLIHPGAILCMIDLLPAIEYECVMSQGMINVIHYEESSVISGYSEEPCENLRYDEECTDVGKQVKAVSTYTTYHDNDNISNLCTLSFPMYMYMIKFKYFVAYNLMIFFIFFSSGAYTYKTVL